jgi:hypothetical protein
MASLQLSGGVAQEPPIEGEDPGDLANYPYTHDVGFGGYGAGEQEVRSLRIPYSRIIRSTEDHPWGLWLRFPVTFGAYSLELGDFLEDFDLDRIQAMTFVPAAEFLIPLSKHWMLKPRQDLGVGKDFTGGDWILIAATGVRAVYTKPWKSFLFTFGPGTKYTLSRSSSGLNDDDFALVEAGLDTLFPVGLHVGDHRVDSSVFFIARHYFRELAFGQVLDEPVVIEQEFEVGITIGSTPRPRIWKLQVSRLLIGYRFSENLKGIRIKFGLPF